MACVHAVGFVEYVVLNLIEHRVLGLDVVEQPFGGRNQHLDADLQLQRLRLTNRTAERSWMCLA